MAKFNARAFAGAVIGAAVVAGALSLVEKNNPPNGTATSDKGKEQCYGVANAGENGCAAANGSHSCSGLATLDNNGQDWKLVEVGTCVQMGGRLEAFESEAPATDDSKGG